MPEKKQPSKNKIVAQVKDTEILPAKKLTEYLDTMGIGTNLDKSQKNMFIEIAQAYGLNPFKREIHPVAYYSKKEGKYVLSIITGYEVYLKRAERTGKLDGWESGVKKEDGDLIGWVKINRKDWGSPFYHEVYYREVAQRDHQGNPTSFWAKAPRFQLKKVAISQGFRLCFPDELGGMPYTSDELPDDMAGRETRDVTEPEKEPAKKKKSSAKKKPEPEKTKKAPEETKKPSNVSNSHSAPKSRQEPVPAENQAIYSVIMSTINEKKDGKPVFTAQQKIEYKKSADAVSQDHGKLVELQKAIAKVVQVAKFGEPDVDPEVVPEVTPKPEDIQDADEDGSQELF